MQATAPTRINGKGGHMPKETMSVTLVTPAMATAWLANGGANRNVSKRRVEQYAAAIRRGEWRLTYEAIKLDRDGKVRDGQHRLQAIAVSGIPIQALVVYGVDEDAFDVMDSGKVRSVADVLSIHDVESSDAVSAVVRFLVIWTMDHRHGVYGANTPTITAPQVLAYLEEHDDAGQWLEAARQISRANVRGGRAMWAGLLTIFGRIDYLAAEEFAEAVVSGANLSPGSPMLTLRKQLINLQHGSGRAGTNRTACWIIKAWNAHRKGEHVYQLKWGNDEAFPEPE
jgi:hypothetical protein